MRGETLEGLFLGLLDTLRPRPGVLPLFREIVLDLWKRQRVQDVQLRAGNERRLDDLRRRESLLEDAFVFERQIDRPSYERKRDQLRGEINAVSQELDDADDELDVDGLLAFAEDVLSNAPQLWLDAELDQKLTLQRVLFPEGLQFENGGFRTNLF